MAHQVYDLIECESFSLRISSGEYQSFMVVDNKKLFHHFRKTNEDFKYRLVTHLCFDSPIFAIYKKAGDFEILVCAFSEAKEINSEAKEIIKNSEKLRMSFQGLMEYSK